MSMYKIGIGYDVHRLVKGRRLVLGGVSIPFEKGLLGHSDADVLAHAVTDALLGACSLGDIGGLFPDNDARYKDADSIALLKTVAALIAEKGYAVGNIDTVVIAEAPKLSPFAALMRANIAEALGIDIDGVSVKATTEEGLGLAGEGIGAKAVCILYKN